HVPPLHTGKSTGQFEFSVHGITPPPFTEQLGRKAAPINTAQHMNAVQMRVPARKRRLLEMELRSQAELPALMRVTTRKKKTIGILIYERFKSPYLPVSTLLMPPSKKRFAQNCNKPRCDWPLVCWHPHNASGNRSGWHDPNASEILDAVPVRQA